MCSVMSLENERGNWGEPGTFNPPRLPSSRFTVGTRVFDPGQKEMQENSILDGF